MAVATQKFLQDHRGSMAGYTEALELGKELDEMLLRITATNNIVLNDPGPAIRERCRQYRMLAINALMVVADVTSNWSRAILDQKVVHSLVTTAPYLLMKLSETNRVDRMRAMLEACEAVAPGMPPGSLTPEHYRNARASFELYAADSGLGRKSDAERVGAGDTLKDLIRDCRRLLKHLDRLMRQYKIFNPELFHQYRSVRNIVEHGGTSRRSQETEVKRARKAADRAQQKAIIAAEKARIAAEDAANRLRLAELRKPQPKPVKGKSKRKSKVSDPAENQEPTSTPAPTQIATPAPITTSDPVPGIPLPEADRGNVG